MKKVLNLILVAVLACMAVFGLVACDSPSGVSGKTGLLYKKVSDDTCLIYGYKDDGSKAPDLNIGAVLEIPEGVTKVRIKKNAFAGNDTLKNIVVPSTVTEIEGGAFAKMQELESIEVPFIGRFANSDAYQSESASAIEKAVDAERTLAHFFGSEEYDDSVSMTINYGASSTTCYVPATFKKVVIKSESAYSVPMYAFNGAVKLQEVVLGDNVDAIGVKAFAGTVFNSIEIPVSVKNIYDGAFENAKIKTVNFVAGASEIVLGDNAFAGCSSLNKLNSNNDKTVDLSVFKAVGKDAFNVGNEVKYEINNPSNFDLSKIFGEKNFAVAE